MKRFVVLSAVLLASTAAHAGDSYSFDIGGRTVTIDAPSDCNSTDCVSVSIPGVFEYNTKRVRRDRDAREQAPANPAPATPAPSTPAPAITATAPENSSPSTEPAAKPASPTVVATAPAADPVPKTETPAAVTPAAAASPLGVWMTEKKEGRVRIESCGFNLCGYAIDAKTDANGDRVLINMKPAAQKWSGKIFDPKSGSTYDSTIALNGSDSLRVQGCAFGGMFCGGQTWTRVN